MHTAGLVEFLGRAGYDVRHFYARYPAWAIGWVKDDEYLGGRKAETSGQELGGVEDPRRTLEESEGGGVDTFGQDRGGVGDPRRTQEDSGGMKVETSGQDRGGVGDPPGSGRQRREEDGDLRSGPRQGRRPSPDARRERSAGETSGQDRGGVGDPRRTAEDSGGMKMETSGQDRGGVGDPRTAEDSGGMKMETSGQDRGGVGDPAEQRPASRSNSPRVTGMLRTSGSGFAPLWIGSVPDYVVIGPVNLFVSAQVGTRFAWSVSANGRQPILKDDCEVVHRLSPFAELAASTSWTPRESPCTPASARLLIWVLLAVPRELANHAVHGLDGIGRIDRPADRRRELEHSRDVRPLQTPLLDDGRIFLTPTLSESVQGFFGFTYRRGLVDLFQVYYHLVAVFVHHVLQAARTRCTMHSWTLASGYACAKRLGET